MLYGADASEGLVGAAQHSSGMSLWWRRPGEAATRREDIEYRPWCLCSHRELLDAVKWQARGRVIGPDASNPAT